MFKRSKLIVFMIILSIITFIFAGCGGGDKKTDSKDNKNSKELVIATPEEIEGTDIEQVKWSNIVHDLIFQPLVAYDLEVKKLIPSGAVSFETSADGKEFTFKLPADASFSNGDPLTSEDLKKSMLKEIHDFGLTSIAEIIIDKKFNITYVQNNVMVKFSEIAEGEQLRVKLAFYLSLIQLDIEKNHGRHTRFLIVDSPNKEEGDTAYLEGLRAVLNQIQTKYHDQLQIIIGTATREFSGVVRNEKIYGKGEYLF